MDMMRIKFADDLVPLIKDGSKTITYRLDRKFAGVRQGEALAYTNRTGVVQGVLQIERVETATFGALPYQRLGHEPYRDKAHQYTVFTSYYGRRPEADDPVDVLHFVVVDMNPR